MIIKILGKQDKICSRELKSAAAFFAEYLLGPRLAKTLNLTISFSPQGKKTDGRCLPIDFFEKSPRIYYIGIKPTMSRKNIMEALAHEMVHVKQYVKREFNVGWKTASFNGRTYELPEDTNMETYFNWPWEIEAYGRQFSLVYFFRCFLKQNKITFKNGRAYVGGKLIRKGMKP